MKLVNAEERAKEFAEFEIPSRAIRESLAVGDMAKLIFLAEDGPEHVVVRGESTRATSERMWVRVTARLVTGRYGGTLSNKPSFLPLTFGDSVTFGPEHIIDVKRLAS